MKTSRALYLLTFFLAFCGFIYELILTQTLSISLGDPLLKYLLMFGLFIAAFEVGRFFPRDRLDSNLWPLHILEIETFSALVGGFSVIGVIFLGRGRCPQLFLNISVYILVVLLAFLKGLEISLLGVGINRDEDSLDGLLSFFYLGIFAAAWSFVLALLPALGLMATAFFIGCCNAGAGMTLFTQRQEISRQHEGSFYLFLYSQLFLSVLLASCLLNADAISHFLFNLY